MFWALAQREKDRKKWREEALKEGRELGFAMGREEGREEGREGERSRIEQELAVQGIAVSTEALEIIRSAHNGNGDGSRNS